jgi:tetraacyldisaccharide 4'-kinase
MSADAFFQRVWYRSKPSWVSNLLLPLSWIFACVVHLRRFAYSSGLARQRRLARPVVVVGNITVGGTGKTPLTIWLANRLAARGHRVGIVLRGYGAKPVSLPLVVDPNTPWESAGDEACVIAQATRAIVVVDPDRVRAAEKAIALGAQMVISDDGLQHLRLGRDFEIAVLDANRELGNARMLPAGPLREPEKRLNTVNVCVFMHRDAGSTKTNIISVRSRSLRARAHLGEVRSLLGSASRPLSQFAGRRVHAVAGIGNPSAFFGMLRAAGVQVVEHSFPDHAVLARSDLDFGDDAPVLMTLKDAVKCRAFADERMWAVHMDISMDPQVSDHLMDEIDRIIVSHPSNCRSH